MKTQMFCLSQVGENQYALVGMPLVTSIVPLIQLLKDQES